MGRNVILGIAHFVTGCVGHSPRLRQGVIPLGVSARQNATWQDTLGTRERKLSPRMKLAIRLWSSGSVRTKAQAARTAGINEHYFYMLTSPAAGNDEVSNLTRDYDQLIQDRSIDLTVLIDKLGDEAIRHMGGLMKHSDKDEVQLRAAIELADRNPRTAKIQKHQQLAPTLDEESARHLAAALVEAAEARRRHMHVVRGNHIGVDESTPFDPSVLGTSEDMLGTTE